MYGLTRGVMTLIGVAIAGGLVWLASWIGPMESVAAFWAAMGIVAGAGVVLAFSQLAGGWTKWGRPSASPTVFLLGFLPALVAGGWILLAAQPEGGVGRERVLDWSATLGIGSLVADLTLLAGAIAFGVGLVFGLVFDTRGPDYEEDVEATYPRYADEPTTAERERAAAAQAARERAHASREPAAVGARGDGRPEGHSPAAPQPDPEAEPRRRRSFFRR